MTIASSPKPHPHADHPHHHEHPGQHDSDCPEHMERCVAQFTGYMDCPTHEECFYKTTMLTVGCGADDPKPQIQAHLNVPGNAYDEVIQVIDLGHDGWLVIFKHPV